MNDRTKARKVMRLLRIVQQQAADAQSWQATAAGGRQEILDLVADMAADLDQITQLVNELNQEGEGS